LRLGPNLVRVRVSNVQVLFGQGEGKSMRSAWIWASFSRTSVVVLLRGTATVLGTARRSSGEPSSRFFKTDPLLYLVEGVAPFVRLEAEKRTPVRQHR